jgi:hypothetical protein
MQAFVALQILGGVSFILILLSAIVAQYRGASRHPTFFSFCLAWIIFCVAYSLLFLAGQQTIVPDHKLCIVQSALIYSAPPLSVRNSGQYAPAHLDFQVGPGLLQWALLPM